MGRDSGFIRKAIQQAKDKAKDKNQGTSAIVSSTGLTPGEYTSGLYRQLTTEGAKASVYSAEEKYMDDFTELRIKKEIDDFQKKVVLEKEREIKEATAKEKGLKAKIDAEKAKLGQFRLNPVNQGTGLTATGLNPAAEILYQEMEKNVNQNLSPVIAEYEKSKQETIAKIKDFSKTQEYLKATKRIEELEDKSTVFNKKNVASAAIGVAVGDPLYGGSKMEAMVILGGAMKHISKSFSPTEDNLSSEEKKEYIGLKNSVRSIHTPLIQDFVDKQKELLASTQNFARDNSAKLNTGDKLLAHYSGLELERAIEGGEDYLKDKGGANIFLRELGRITVNKDTGPVEDIQRNLLGDFWFKDRLFKKEKEVGYENLDPIEQQAFEKYEAAQHLNQEMADKHGYGYNTVKGTIGSLAFVRDMWLPNKFITGAGKVFGAERAFIATNAALKAEALAGKTAGKATELGIKSLYFGAETIGTTYMNPKAINDYKDPMGVEMIRDSKGKIVDVLTRQDLYEDRKKELDREKIKLSKTKQTLESKSNLSEEDKQFLKTVKARLGEGEVEGIFSIDEELSNYKVSSEAGAHLKGIASTAVEKLSELYTKDALKLLGKGGTAIVPGSKKLVVTAERGLAVMGDKFYSTGLGKAYKNWQNLVGKLTIGNRKIIGSVFEEIPEEYAAAIGHGILDGNTKDLDQLRTTQGTLDLLGQTALMNVLMGGAQGASTSSKLLYNKVYNNKIKALDQKIKDFEEISKANPEDKDTQNAVIKLKQEKQELEKRSTITGLGITSRVTGDKTGFSSTKNYINSRQEVRKTIEKLREASTDEAINTAIDVATLGTISTGQKQSIADELRATGNTQEAELIEKSIMQNLITKALDTNTEDELRAGLEKTLRTKGITPEKQTQLSEAKDMVEELIEVKKQYEGNSKLGQALKLTLDHLTAKAEVKTVDYNLASLQNSAKERIDAFIKAKGLTGINYNMATLLDQEFEDPQEQKKYDNFLEELQGFQDGVVQGYLKGLDLKNEMESLSANSIISRSELLHPTLESLNGEKFLKEVSNAGRNLIERGENALGIEGIEYDSNNKIVKSPELVTSIYNKIGENWIGDSSKGKISRPTFERLKNAAIQEHKKTSEFLKEFEKVALAQEAAKKEMQKLEPSIIASESPLLDSEEEIEVVLDVLSEEQSQEMANEAYDAIFNLGQQSTSNITNTPEAVVVTEDDLEDAFGSVDEMLFARDEYSKEEEEILKSWVAKMASKINSITNQDVSLTELVEFYFRSVSNENKAKALGTIKKVIHGWQISKNSDGSPFQIQENEIESIWNKFSPLILSDIAEEALLAFSESLPNLHIRVAEKVESPIDQTNASKVEAEKLETKDPVTKAVPLSELDEITSENFKAEEVPSTQPRIGFNSMPYEVVVEEGVFKKKTKGSLMKDFTNDPMGVDPRPLLDPDNGPKITLGIDKAPESDWDKIPVSNGYGSDGKVMLISFSQWVQENKSNPNFAQMFSEKVPYYYTFEGKRVGAIHDTDWYNEYNVPNPLKNDVAYKNSIVWQQAVEAGKEAERKLRKAIENGLTEVTASKPATVKYHTLDPLGGEPLLTLRESNPQGIVVVQRGTDNLISSLPQNLRKDFEQGRKKIVNKTEDSKGAINASTSGHVWQLHRLGTEINPVTGEKIETYQAIKSQGYITQEVFNSLQWAIVAHKVLTNKSVPSNFTQGLNPTDLMKFISEKFANPIYKTMGLNLKNPADLGKYIQHFAKISVTGLALLNANKIKAQKEGENKAPWKNVEDGTAVIAYQYFLLENNFSFENLTKSGQEILLRNNSISGLASNKGVFLLSKDGVQEHKTPTGEKGSYTDYVQDTTFTEVKSFDVSTNSVPKYALGVQPVIYIDYNAPTSIQKAEIQDARAKAIEEAKVEMELEKAETPSAPVFDLQVAIDYLDSLGINIEDFTEEEVDELIGDPDKIKDLFNLIPGLTTMDETFLKGEIAHEIMSLLDFKSTVNFTTQENIKKEVTTKFTKQLNDILNNLKKLESKIGESTEDKRTKATLSAIKTHIIAIDNVKSNIDSLYKKALKEVNNQAKVEMGEEVEDFTLSEKDYSKESVEESLKTKASARLRMLFSNIPAVDSKGGFVKGFLGFKKRLSLNDVYNEVLRNLSISGDSISDFDTLIDRLESSESPIMKEVVNRLKKGDSQIQNEFVYNVVAHTLSSKFAMYEKTKNGFSLKMYDTNANDVSRALKNIWKENSIASELYNYDGTINTEHAKLLISKFENFSSDLNVVDPQDLRDWLSAVGMEIHDQTWNKIYAVEKGITSGSNFISFENLYSAKTGGLFFPMVQFLKNAVDNPIAYSLEEGKMIFDDIRGISNAIVKIEAKYNPQLISLSFRDGDKSIFTQTPPKYATDKVTELVSSAKGNKEYLDKLRSISFTQDSLILNLLDENPYFRDLFKIHHVANNSLKERNTKSFGRTDITSLSDIDYDLLTTTGFSDRRVEKLQTNGEAVQMGGFKLRLANMLFPTMSDKSTSLFLTTPVFDFLDTPEEYSFMKEGESITGITQDVKDVLFNYLVLPELKRIHKFYSEVKSTNIKGYDKGAGMFHLLPIMNTLIDPASQTSLLEILKNTSEIHSLENFIELYGDQFKNSIEGVVKREVGLKLKEWAPAIEKNAMFGTEYFTAIGKDPVKDYEAAVYDYVMNSMISNAEMFKVFAGDVALYSQDKLIKENILSSNPIEYINVSRQIGVNLGKRLALLIAPGKKIANSYKEGEREYNQIFLADSVDIAQNASFLIEMYYSKQDAENAKPILEKYSRAKKALDHYKQLQVKGDKIIKQKEAISKYQALVDKYRKQLQSDYKSIGDYFDIESTDAQEYTTITEHVNILLKLGRISSANETTILNKLASGEELTKEELSLVMQPIKPVYTGTHINKELDVNQTIYIKSSSFPLIPQLTAGTQLEELRKTMEKLEAVTGRFTRASYQTANKVGAVLDKNTIDPLDHSQLNKVFEGLNSITGKYDPTSRNSSVMVLDRNNFRIQQDVPFKSDKKKKDEVALGTQIFKLLFGDGVIDEVIETKENGTKVTGRDLYNNYNKSFTTLVNLKKESLFEELGLDKKGKIQNPEDFYSKLQNLLIKEATDRGYSLKSIRGLSLDKLVVAATGTEYREFKIPLWLSPDSNRYESLLNSIVTNRIMKHKFPGNGFVAGSETGFKFKENLKGLDKSRIIYLDNWNGEELQGTSITQEDGTPIFTKAQVFAPSKFKNKEGKLIDLFESFNGKEGKYLIKKENKLTLKEGVIDKELLNFFSFRTPTSAHVSGSSIEVVGILPPESGDLMIVPKNFTKQKGLDYDIDKESAYQLNNYTDEFGNIKVLDKQGVEAETKQTKEKLERLHLDLLSAKRKGFPLQDMFEETKSLLSHYFNEEELNDIFNPEIKLLDKLKTLDNSLKRKLAENEFIKSHLAVYNSTNPNIQKRINKILSMDFAKDQAKQMEKLSEEGEKQSFISNYKIVNPLATQGEALKAYDNYFKNFSVLNYSYQKEKMKLGSVGKGAIGVYANYTTFSALIQTNIGSQGMQILKNGNPRVFVIGEASSGSLGAVKTLDGDRNTSEVYNEKVNTATDNEKEQVLGRVGVNEATVNVDAFMTLRGFDKTKVGDKEYSIPYLLISQPSVKEYLKILKESKGIFGEYKDKNKVISETISLLTGGKTTYSLQIESGKYEFVEEGKILDYNGSKRLTGSALVAGIEDNGKDKDIQAHAFMSFIELEKEARHIASAQKVINLNSLGKSMIESMSKNQALAVLVDSPIIPSVTRLIGKVRTTEEEGYLPFSYDKETSEGTVKITHYIKPTTPQGQIVVNGLHYGNELFKDFFPYKDPAIQHILKEIGLPENETARIDKIESIVEEIKKYQYSNPNIGIYFGDPIFKRQEIFIDNEFNTSVSSYLKNTLKSKETKYSKGIKAINDNPLLKRMIFESGKGKEKLSLIKYNNSANDNLDEESLYNSLPELINLNLPLPPKNGKPYSTVLLAEDLVAYAFLEGGIQEATQFIKFVPVELLEAMGKLDKKGNFVSIAKLLRMLNSKSSSNKNILNNALGIRMGQPSYFTTQYFQHNPSQSKKIQFKDVIPADENYNSFSLDSQKTTLENYLHVGKEGAIRLYEHQGGGVYTEIPVIKSMGISQYHYGSNYATGITETTFTPPVKSIVEDESKTVVGPAETMTIQKLMEEIGDYQLKEGYEHLTTLAKWLAPYTKGQNTLTIADIQKGSLGFTTAGLDITLNKKVFKSKEILAQTMVHEFIHHVTTKELAKYYDPSFTNLKEGIEIPQHVKDLHTAFTFLQDKVSKVQGYQEFMDSLAIYKNPGSATQEKMEAHKILAASPFKDLFYASYNIKEFIAMSLTDSVIQSQLNALGFPKTNKSVLEKIWEALQELFSTTFPSIKEDTLAFEALKSSMKFIEIENKARQNNSVPLPNKQIDKDFYKAKEESLMYQKPSEEDTSPNLPESFEEQEESDEALDFTEEEWNQLTEEEKERIKYCN